MPYYFRVDIDPENLGMIVIAEYVDDVSLFSPNLLLCHALIVWPQKNVSNRAYAYRGTINVVEPAIRYYDLQS